MSTEIIKVLDDLSSRFGIAIDWTSQNVAPYIQQLIGRIQGYSITINAIAAVCMVAIIVVAVVWYVKLYKRHKDDNKYCDELSTMEFALNIAFGVVGAVALMLLPCAICDLAQAIFIPELTVIEKITSLLQ